jgi:hypothetical protein
LHAHQEPATHKSLHVCMNISNKTLKLRCIVATRTIVNAKFHRNYPQNKVPAGRTISKTIYVCIICYCLPANNFVFSHVWVFIFSFCIGKASHNGRANRWYSRCAWQANFHAIRFFQHIRQQRTSIIIPSKIFHISHIVHKIRQRLLQKR